MVTVLAYIYIMKTHWKISLNCYKWRQASGCCCCCCCGAKIHFSKWRKFNLQMQPDEEASRKIYQRKLALSLWQSNLGQPIWVCVPHPPAQPSQIIAASFTIPNPKFQSTSNCLLFDQLNDRRAGQAAVLPVSRTFWIWYSRTKNRKAISLWKRRRLQRTDNIQSALEYTNYVWVLCQALCLRIVLVPNCFQAYFKCFWCMFEVFKLNSMKQTYFIINFKYFSIRLNTLLQRFFK